MPKGQESRGKNNKPKLTPKAKPENVQYRASNIKFWENEKLIYDQQLRDHQRSRDSLSAFKLYLQTLSAKPEASNTEASRGADDIDISAPADMSADDVDLKSINESRYYIKVKLS